MTNLRDAQKAGDLEPFIAAREAEGQAPGDADKFDHLLRRVLETPKSVKRTSSPVRSGD